MKKISELFLGLALGASITVPGLEIIQNPEKFIPTYVPIDRQELCIEMGKVSGLIIISFGVIISFVLLRGENKKIT